MEKNKIPLEKLRTACIINPQAANRKWKRSRLLRTYLQKQLPGRIIDTRQDKRFTIETAKELSNNHDVIVAAGGDGTIADVIQGIMESTANPRPLLGIIPLGSGNAFRKSLGIPKMIPLAIYVVKTGGPVDIDLIRINGKTAAFTSIGFTATVTMKKNLSTLPGLKGHLWSARDIINYPKKQMEIYLRDGWDDRGRPFNKKLLKRKVFDLVINKTKHFGYGWKISPRARIDDGLLDITLFEFSGWQYLLSFPLNFLGIIQISQKHYKTKKISIKGKDLAVQYNGEPFGIRQEVTLEVIPKALTVICPRWIKQFLE
ncbi:MAG: diacylglycerol/lipid kinase family protein [Acidobacteriota bacterium]